MAWMISSASPCAASISAVFSVCVVRRFHRVFVVQVVQQPGQRPGLRVLAEMDGEIPHAGLDGQAVLDQVAVVQVLLQQVPVLVRGSWLVSSRAELYAGRAGICKPGLDCFAEMFVIKYSLTG